MGTEKAKICIRESKSEMLLLWEISNRITSKLQANFLFLKNSNAWLIEGGFICEKLK
jgi:hypothetical protein